MNTFTVFSPFDHARLSPQEEAYRASPLATLSNDERKATAKRWGALHGYEGASGGNIYAADGRRICQGWWTFFNKYRYRILADVEAGTFKVSRSKGGA